MRELWVNKHRGGHLSLLHRGMVYVLHTGVQAHHGTKSYGEEAG